MCNIGDLISETLVPGVPETFFVNTTKVPLMDNEMYCYDVTLQEATICELGRFGTIKVS